MNPLVCRSSNGNSLMHCRVRHRRMLVTSRVDVHRPTLGKSPACNSAESHCSPSSKCEPQRIVLDVGCTIGWNGFNGTGMQLADTLVSQRTGSPVVKPSRNKLAMQPSRTPSSPSSHNGLTGFAISFNRLAALWSTPRVGRVAICSPLVGVIAGLGAVGFLLVASVHVQRCSGGIAPLPFAADERR